MRVRRLLLVVPFALLAPIVAHGDVVPGAVPDLTLLTAQVPRGTLATSFIPSTVAPTTKVIDGAIDEDWIGDIERHEALFDRAEMKGLRRRLVAAGRLKLGAV